MYRFDRRNKQEFARDIKQTHRCEAQIAIRYGIYLYKLFGRWPTIVPVGTDYTGKVVKNNQASRLADYQIDDQFIEITHSVNKIEEFRPKVYKVTKCLDGEYDILFANGFSADRNVEFLLLNKANLKPVFKQYDVRTVGVLARGTTTPINKDAYLMKYKWFDTWSILPRLHSKIPKSYKDILKAVK